MSDAATAAPGWHTFPDGSGRLRYWTGVEWTEWAPDLPESQCWQYRVISRTFGAELESVLNDMGAQGWEVISIAGMNGTFTLTGNMFTVVMKRPVPGVWSPAVVERHYQHVAAAHPVAIAAVMPCVEAQRKRGVEVNVTAIEDACVRVEAGTLPDRAVVEALMAQGH